MPWLFIWILLFFTSCERSSPTKNAKDLIQSRMHQPLYQATVPLSWKKFELEESLEDTTKPLVEYKIGSINITVHNFPGISIPPEAQVERWKKQLHSTSFHLLEITGSGFYGLQLEADNHENALLAWALQLDPEHYQTLKNSHLDPEMQASYTIKALGPKEEIEKQREEIVAFAESFELIQEIP